MSQIQNETAFKEAAEFARQQDKTVQFWAGRHVAVQAGLAIAESALYTWGSASQWFTSILATLLAIVSVALIWTITAILVRECKWHALYVDMIKRTEGTDPLLFQPGYKIPGLNIPGILAVVRWVLTAAWVLFAVLVWVAYSCPSASS